MSLTGTKPGSAAPHDPLAWRRIVADAGETARCQPGSRPDACGTITAMLVQAVHLLHRHRDELPGTVKFMFQPGEEGHAGARRMIEDGLLDADPKPDAAFALHIFPNFKAGAIAGRPGPILASVDTWTIKVKGSGGHASMPHLAVDPVPVACEIGLALHAMVTRRTNVFDPAVLTLGKITGGTASNIIRDGRDARHAAHDLRGGARLSGKARRVRSTSLPRIPARPPSTSGRATRLRSTIPALSISRAASRPRCRDNYILMPAPPRVPRILLRAATYARLHDASRRQAGRHDGYDHVASCHPTMILNETPWRSDRDARRDRPPLS